MHAVQSSCKYEYVYAYLASPIIVILVVKKTFKFVLHTTLNSPVETFSQNIQGTETYFKDKVKLKIKLSFEMFKSLGRKVLNSYGGISMWGWDRENGNQSLRVLHQNEHHAKAFYVHFPKRHLPILKHQYKYQNMTVRMSVCSDLILDFCETLTLHFRVFHSLALSCY